jgi:7-cyano-7-deazaguanine synthase in queuosine biosynthesis
MKRSPEYIYCDGYDNKPITRIKNVHRFDIFNEDHKKNNILFKLEEFEPLLINYKSTIGYDLINIASYIYCADCQIPRGTTKDVYGENWVRHLNFYIPVIEPDLWNKPTVKDSLIKTLEFLTGDIYSFEFCKGKNVAIQYKLDLKPDSIDQELRNRKCVSLFSGGIDSLYAAIELLNQKREPVFISHKSSPVLMSYRKDLMNKLREEYGKKFQNIEVTITNKNNTGKESSQRSRSFLYASLAAAFARCFNLKDVYLSDNGPITFNLPYTNQNIGTLNSRSTNPKFLSLFNTLLEVLWEDKAPVVSNLLIWKTRGEIVKELKELNKSHLLSYTTSCAHTRNISKSHPYCGICSQCIDRRFAVEWSEISDNDDPRFHYETDIFWDNLKEGIAKTHAENFYRRANTIEQIDNISNFYYLYPDLNIYGEDEKDFATFVTEAYKLHKRHSNQLIEVIKRMIPDTFEKNRQNKLNSNCLMAMIYRNSAIKEEPFSEVDLNDLILIKEARELILYGLKVDLTDSEYKFLIKLAKKPDQWVKYKDLSGDDINVSDVVKERKNKLQKKLLEVFKENRKSLNLIKDLFDNKQNHGYKLNLTQDQIKII